MKVLDDRLKSYNEPLTIALRFTERGVTPVTGVHFVFIWFDCYKGYTLYYTVSSRESLRDSLEP